MWGGEARWRPAPRLRINSRKPPNSTLPRRVARLLKCCRHPDRHHKAPHTLWRCLPRKIMETCMPTSALIAGVLLPPPVTLPSGRSDGSPADAVINNTEADREAMDASPAPHSPLRPHDNNPFWLALGQFTPTITVDGLMTRGQAAVTFGPRLMFSCDCCLLRLRGSSSTIALFTGTSLSMVSCDQRREA
jgi:hypothetical protein